MVQWRGLCTSTAGARVQPLVREFRSCKPRSAASAGSTSCPQVTPPSADGVPATGASRAQLAHCHPQQQTPEVSPPLCRLNGSLAQVCQTRRHLTANRHRKETPWLCCEGSARTAGHCALTQAGPQAALTAPWLRPQSHPPAGVGELHLPPPWTPTGFQWTCELAPGGPCIFPGVGIQTLVTENAETGTCHKKSRKPRPHQVPVPPPGSCGLGSGPELPSPRAQAHPGDTRVWAVGGGVDGGSAGQEGLEGRGELQAYGAPRLLGVTSTCTLPQPPSLRRAGHWRAGARVSPSFTRYRAYRSSQWRYSWLERRVSAAATWFSR